jgi:predicted  nucleic acid-binding Zn-ribbon protein
MFTVWHNIFCKSTFKHCIIFLTGEISRGKHSPTETHKRTKNMANRIKDALDAAASIANQETQIWASRAAQCRHDGDEESSDMYEQKRMRSSSMTKKIEDLAATV